MRSSSILMGLMAASSTAAPLEKRANFDAPPGGDVTILNYALTLEYLERKFYQEGLANYTKADFEEAGFDGDFYHNLKEIYSDEKTHVSYISGALGTSAVHEANYSFPSTDAKSFVQLASVLEGVGVSAYLGAAAAIANKAYLTVAGSILTVESRHSAYIRAELGDESPFPKAFDTPLDFNSVFSLAAEFITGFAKGDPALPFTAFPTLTVVAGKNGKCEPGSSAVTFTGAYTNAQAKGLVKAKASVYAVFYSGLDTYYVKASVANNGKDYEVANLPGANYGKAGTLAPAGQVYVVLSTADGNKTTVADENVISGVGILEVV